MIMLESTTRISNGSSFQGNLSTAGKLIVAGQVDGNATVHGIFQLNQSGRCNGNIEAQVVIVAGKVDGDIHGQHRVELQSDAIVFGNITTPEVLIHEGAKVTGYVNMGKQPRLTLVDSANSADNVTHFKTKNDQRINKYG